jgi:hypothetical protein
MVDFVRWRIKSGSTSFRIFHSVEFLSIPESSFQSFLLTKSHRWTGLPVSSSDEAVQGRDESEYAEVDTHRALGGRTFPDLVKEGGNGKESKAKGEGDEKSLPVFGRGMRKYWGFDPDCMYLA